jgi:hypothetical protein
MLNRINLLISRAVDRLIDLVNLNDVREVAIDRIACNAREDDIVEGVVNHPRVAREFHNISSRAVAKHVDLGDLASEIDLTDLASNLDHSDIASEIDLSDLASNIDLGDLAGEAGAQAGQRAQVPSPAMRLERIG